MRELSIVVTCTGRKALPTERGLRVRDLPVENLTRRSDIWGLRVHASGAPRRMLRELYRGEAWQRSLALASHAHAAGYVPTTYVASAGLGLRSLEYEAPAYSATFSAGDDDAVAPDDAGRSAWWRALRTHPGALAIEELPAVPTLVVLSAAYAAPLGHGLGVLAGRGAELLIVGGGGAVPGAAQLAANRGLRGVLGGSVMSLNQRMASAWLDRLDGLALTDPRLFSRWSVWEQEAQRVESWGRQALTDELLIRRIQTLRSTEEGISASRALRVLRASGFACEQKRFGRLFAAAAALEG